MPCAPSRPVTITLGKQQASVDVRVASVPTMSASKVVRAALRALDREEAALHEVLRAKVKGAIDDLRPCIPSHQVFADLRALHSASAKAPKGVA